MGSYRCDYTDTEKLMKDFQKYSPEVTQPLLDIKQSTHLRNTLTDLGYDSIHANDDYILFDNAQLKVTKKLKIRNNFSTGGRVGYADGDKVDLDAKSRSKTGYDVGFNLYHLYRLGAEKLKRRGMIECISDVESIYSFVQDYT